eukprot:3133342-Rhodomonas_salina.1
MDPQTAGGRARGPGCVDGPDSSSEDMGGEKGLRVGYCGYHDSAIRALNFNSRMGGEAVPIRGELAAR